MAAVLLVTVQPSAFAGTKDAEHAAIWAWHSVRGAVL
jgi:hypothetical protein